MFRLIFFLLFFIYILTYLGYFIFILENYRRDCDVKKISSFFPSVSLIICAYNEEKSIEKKIRNTLAIKYPKDRLEIIVFDNGSEDRTFEVAKKFSNKGIKVYKLNGKNRGKSAGLNVSFKYAKGEIIVITDVDCLLQEDVLIKSMPYFADPNIGAVTGCQILLNPEESQSSRMEGILQSYYKYIRKAESIVDSTIVFNGEFTAFRKDLINKLDEEVGADDTQIAIKVREQGYRAIFLDNVNFYEYASSTYKSRWKQKVRRSSQVIQALLEYKHLMFNRKYGIYGKLIYPWNFFMHIISPYIFVILTIMCMFLLIQSFWSLIYPIIGLMMLLVVIAIAIDGYLNKRFSNPLNFILTFIHAQISLFIGSILLIKGKPYKWEPIKETRRF